MKKISYILMAAATALALAACSQTALDKVNEDINHAHDADAKFVFADASLATAFSTVGGDLNTYLGVAVEHWGGVHNQLYKADHRNGEWISSSCFNNSWVSIYNTIKNCRVVIEKTADDATGVDAGNGPLNAAAKVLLAYNSAVLTDLFGDAPYSEACDYEHYKTPKLDSQADIYSEIFTLLNDAITTLEAADGARLGTGSYDFIYGGNSALWLKFAFGLRARLTLHTILKASSMTAAYDSILSDLSKSFASPKDQAQVSAYDGSNNINPLFGFFVSREAIGASESLYNKLHDRNDPRLQMSYCWNWYPVFDPEDPEEGFEPVPNGTGIEAQYYYSEDVYFYSIDAPTHLLSYAETEYIKAEILARTGSYTEARAALSNALHASFQNVNECVLSAQQFSDIWGYGIYGPAYDGDYLTDADADAYVAATFDTLADSELLAEILIQKYLFLHNANGGSVEAFNDVRRLKAAGENFISLDNPANAAGKFPQRCGYGSSDTTTNPNVQSAFGDGSYVFTEPVWWAGGKR